MRSPQQSAIPPRGSRRRRIARAARPDRSACRRAPEVFSADDHISLSEDIFYEKFPEAMKEQAPAVVYEDGAWTLAIGGKTLPAPGVQRRADAVRPVGRRGTNDVDARLASSSPTASTASSPSPNALLGLMGWPDKAVRELCFRIYNEHIAEVQERSNGRFYGVGMINWWDGDGCRTTLAELKALGLKTFWMPLKPGAGDDGKPIDYNSPGDVPRVGGDRGERSPGGAPHRRGAARLAVPRQRRARRDDAQRRAVPRDVRPLRVRRDPRPPPRPARRLVRGRHQLDPGRPPGRRAPVRVAAAHGRPRDRARRRPLLAHTTCTRRSWSIRWGSR